MWGNPAGACPPSPDLPLLTVEDLGSGAVRFTISGSSVGSSNRVYARSVTSSTWPTSPTVTIAGDGSEDTTLDPGAYLAKVQSELSGIVAPASNEPVLFHLVCPEAGYDRSEFGEEFMACAIPEFLAEMGEPVTYLRGVEAVELAAIQGEVLMANDDQLGVDVQLGDGSWEIAADHLNFGSGAIVPKAQDQIRTEKGEIYIVVEAGVLDAEQLMWTIPTKRADYKDLS